MDRGPLDFAATGEPLTRRSLEAAARAEFPRHPFEAVSDGAMGWCAAIAQPAATA